MLRFLSTELPRVLVRLALAALGYVLVVRVPWPPEAAYWVSMAAAGLLVLVVLIIGGTFLYDTLFYDRYWRSVDSR